MFKKLFILLAAIFLLTGCLDMEDRYNKPVDDMPVEEEVSDEDVTDDDAMEEEEDEEDVTDEEGLEDEDISDDEPTDDEADETGDVTVDEEADDTGDETVDEEIEETADSNDVFVQAFLVKYPDWEERLDILEVTVNNNDGSFASGSIRFTDSIGGGGWLAASTAGGWVIAWDGNGTIGCAEIEPYDFPVSIVPECWDDENQVMVNRGAEEEPLE
ncbi:hypothetical protein KKA33_01005 [Patescibacteria group bacterium]|nr:hypothetical protein [Patescibacteria group bacterium]